MNEGVTRRGFLAAGAATALAGCTGTIGRGSGGGGSSTSVETSKATPGTVSADTENEAVPPLADRSLPLPMSPSEVRAKSVSGGVPKDGIPAIDEPVFESADAADDRLDARAVVFGLAQDGVAKAYPQSILVWHEICNDVVGDTPISVTYCPLTGTTLGFERGETTFGVSGRLVNNNLLMYDRATEHWWPQVLATAVPGWSEDDDASESGEGVESEQGENGDGEQGDGMVGRSLRGFRLAWTTWEHWRTRFPSTRVLTEDTGYVRHYGTDQYGSYTPRKGYYAPESDPLFEPLVTDDRYPPKAVVLGARTPEGAIAFHEPSLRRKGVLTGEIDGTPHVAVHDEQLAAGHVYRNPEDVSIAPADGDTTDGGVRVAGKVHPPADLPLEELHAFDAMWFAWHGFYPEASVRA